MEITPPTRSLFHLGHCGISKTQSTGIGCTGELWETLLCLPGKWGEDTLEHPRWKKTYKFESSSLPRESEGTEISQGFAHLHSSKAHVIQKPSCCSLMSALLTGCLNSVFPPGWCCTMSEMSPLHLTQAWRKDLGSVQPC